MARAYAFDHRHRRPPMEMKDLLGGKGANLAEMTSVLGLPVPPGFTLTTEVCREHRAGGWPDGLDGDIARQLRRVERAMGRRLGDPDDPLLVSVRSGARDSMPGMMDTILDLGLNDRSVEGLARQAGDERFAYDSYRRFIAMYGEVVLGVDGDRFEHLLGIAKEWDGVDVEAALSVPTLRRLCERFSDLVHEATGRPFPQDPHAQLRGAVEAVFRSWDTPRARAYRTRERISHDLGTAVNVQAMVFGNRDDRSGTGVAFTRDAATGEPRPYGDFLANAQGEDVVAGIRATEDLDGLARLLPDVHAELLATLARLERHYRDMCDVEFTVERGRLWILQTRVGKRTAAAAVRMAVDMTSQKGWRITQAEAVARVGPEQLDQLLHPQVAGRDRQPIATGLAASPGAGVGHAHVSADACVEAVERGEKVVLVRTETSPEDVHGMEVAEAVLTARGGLASHAAVVARGWGIPAVVGAEDVVVGTDSFRVGDVVVHAGDVISVDGTAGQVMLGAVELSAPEPPPELETLLGWADRIRRGKLAVRANADTAEDARCARRFGAEGIGLCRTEHMFLAEDRLPIVRELILADDPDREQAALDALGEAQRQDFLGILEAMDGLPVTVRLLDPPLHEFLPSVEELAVEQAAHGLSADQERLLAAARAWHEQNPMLGTRGVRLGVLKPGLYAMQARALLTAALERARDGGRPIVEVMIPLTVSREELAEARGWVTGAAEEVLAGSDARLRVSIGTMIETPRAALRAHELAEAADFFSFGTNDLTQLVFGFSRDDVEGRTMAAYLERGLLPGNPFDSLDADGVGELVATGVERGRASRPRLKIGVCGEHAADPASIAAFRRAGVDYVSCSPYRVPVARLAAAQAVLAERSTTVP